MSSSILINQLVVVGVKKDYTVNFNRGVNIIYGDSATGKSSILNLIDYLLGAKHFSLYPEIESVGRYAVLDVTLNQDRYTIKRDIYDASKLIEVYPCSYVDVESYPSKKYLPSFAPSAKHPGLGFFSEFLIESLNLNNIMIKQAPSKSDSKLSRLSFRDVFKFCYVDQDNLGTKKFLRSDNYALQIRNTEVFKYIFNTLDSQISDVEKNISEKTNMRNELDKKFKTVAEFLRESEFGSMSNLDDDVSSADLDILSIEKQLVSLNERVSSDDEVYLAIQSTLSEVTLEKKAVQQRMEENELKIERFSRLKNEYLIDISKFKSSISARELIGVISDDICLCPVCDNSIAVDVAKSKFDIPSSDKINYEINALKKRVKDTEGIINESKKIWEFDKEKLSKVVSVELEARELFDKNTKELSTPYLAERDMFVNKLGQLKQKRKEYVSRLKIRNQHNHFMAHIESLDISIGNLQDRLEKLKDNAPSMSAVLESLADNLQEYLKFIKIKDPTGVSYTEGKFIPKLRNIEYQNITSGGLRTIMGIGYLCALMKESLNSQMSYPSFLMIDTVGKYLGKTKDQVHSKVETSLVEDEKEAVSDPSKYQNIFEYIINLSEEYEKKNRICQFILVDNDVPDHIVDKLSGFIVAHFSSERLNGLPVGFIDDVKT